MRLSDISCSHWQLYVIVDRAACGGRRVFDVAAAAIRGGADAVQLRDKTGSADRVRREAERLRPLASAAHVALIINDQVDVAMVAEADGVHLGQDDLPVQEARRTIGTSRIIGKSTHSLEQALAAQADGVEYIGLGPIFPTPTKPDYGSVGPALIGQVRSQVHLPTVCIGGIDHRNLDTVIASGATCVAVVRAVCAAADPEQAAGQLKSMLQKYHRAAAPL